MMMHFSAIHYHWPGMAVAECRGGARAEAAAELLISPVRRGSFPTELVETLPLRQYDSESWTVYGIFASMPASGDTVAQPARRPDDDRLALRIDRPGGRTCSGPSVMVLRPERLRCGHVGVPSSAVTPSRARTV